MRQNSLTEGNSRTATGQSLPKTTRKRRVFLGLTAVKIVFSVDRGARLKSLAISKLMAGREKDFEFISELFHHHLATPEIIQERLMRAPVDEARRSLCRERLQRLSSP